MLDFSPTKTTESVTHPGERFTTRRIGPTLRATTELSLAKERAHARDILESFATARDKLQGLIEAAGLEVEGKPLVVSDASKVTPEMNVAANLYADLNEEYALYTISAIKPTWIKAGFVSLESAPDLTADKLLASPYPDLIEEIYQTIYNGAYIQPEQSKTSPSSTTSAAAEDGQTNSTTAESAKSPDTTSGGTVPDTSPTN